MNLLQMKTFHCEKGILHTIWVSKIWDSGEAHLLELGVLQPAHIQLRMHHEFNYKKKEKLMQLQTNG